MSSASMKVGCAVQLTSTANGLPAVVSTRVTVKSVSWIAPPCLRLRLRSGTEIVAEAAEIDTLQRRFEGFPFFQFFHSAFPVGEVSLVIAAGMVLHQYKNVADLTFGLWKAALN